MKKLIAAFLLCASPLFAWPWARPKPTPKPTPRIIKRQLFRQKPIGLLPYRPYPYPKPVVRKAQTQYPVQEQCALYVWYHDKETGMHVPVCKVRVYGNF